MTVIIDPVQEYNNATSLFIREGGALLCVPDEVTPSNSVFWQSVHGYYEEEEPEGHFAVIDPTSRQIIGFTDLDIDLGPGYSIYHAIYDPINGCIWAIGLKDNIPYVTKFAKDGSVLVKSSVVIEDYMPISYTYEGFYTNYWSGYYTVFLTLDNIGVPHIIIYLNNNHFFLENPDTETFAYVPYAYKFKVLKLDKDTAGYVDTVYSEFLRDPAISNHVTGSESYYDNPYNKYFPIIFDENNDIWIFYKPHVYYYNGWWKASTEEFSHGNYNPFDPEDEEPIFIEGNILLDSGGLLKVVSGTGTYQFQFDETNMFDYTCYNIFDIELQKYYFIAYNEEASIPSDSRLLIEFDLETSTYSYGSIKVPNSAIYGFDYIPNSTINFINSHQNLYMLLSSGTDGLSADYRVLTYIPKNRIIKNPIEQANIVYGESEGGGVPPPE